MLRNFVIHVDIPEKELPVLELWVVLQLGNGILRHLGVLLACGAPKMPAAAVSVTLGFKKTWNRELTPRSMYNNCLLVHLWWLWAIILHTCWGPGSGDEAQTGIGSVATPQEDSFLPKAAVSRWLELLLKEPARRRVLRIQRVPMIDVLQSCMPDPCMSGFSATLQGRTLKPHGPPGIPRQALSASGHDNAAQTPKPCVGPESYSGTKATPMA